MTPDEYLPILLAKLSARLPDVQMSRRYVNGDAPLPEMGDNLRESWVAFQKKSRTNLGGRTCESLAGRIIPLGVRVGGNTGPGADAARRIYRDNRLGLVFADAVWNALSTGYGYLLTQDVAGRAVITSERPEQMITIPDPLQPWRAIAGVKAWRDKITGVDHATVWVPGVEQRFRRDSKNTFGSYRNLGPEGWVAGEPVEFDGGVPIQVLENPHGMGEVTAHRDVIDRINLGKLQRLVTVAMQAYRQRVVENLPEDDPDDPVDYGKVFDPAPGAIWDLPEGAKLTELSDGSAGIQAMLAGEVADVREYCGVTGTPMSNFLSDAQNQSAEGAMNAKESEISKAEKRIASFKPSFEGSIVDALRVEGVDAGETVEMEFAPTAFVSFGERAQAANLAKTAGMPTRWIARNIWGQSADQIREIETDIAVEQLSLFGAASGDTA